VKRVGRLRVPRGLSVAIVYLVFVAALIVAIVALTVVVVDQTKKAAHRLNAYFTVPHGRYRSDADRDVDRFQHWLSTHGLHVAIAKRGHDFVAQIRKKDIGRYTTRVVNFLEGAAVSIGKLLFDAVLIFVVSIYMLLDMGRLARGLDRRFPSRAGSPTLLERMENAVVGYM